MRKSFVFLLLCGLVLPAPLLADAATRGKLIQFFGGWYSYYPGSRVSAVETRDVEIPGLETYRIERHCDSKLHRETNYALYDRERDEVFVGDLMYDDARRAASRPFEPAADLPNIQASLRDVFGLPVEVELGSAPRGALRPFVVSVRQQEGAVTRRSGFLSQDGAALLLGEFLPASREAAAVRRAILSKPAAAGAGAARFTVVEFLDFQCERCRVRTPDVRKAVEEKGGRLEVRYLPLVKQHDWAFAAAEDAAALASAGPDLTRRYEELVFARSEKMNAAAARELAADVAEAAGAREKFEAEIASGRARSRVVADIELAMRLGITGTPSFLYEGTFLSGEKGLLESYLWERFGAPARSKPSGGSK